MMSMCEKELSNNFNLKARFIEPETTKDGSRFITDNYDEIVIQVRKMGVQQDMVHDVIADVYISIVNDEEDGEGYDPNKGTTLEEYVYGRLKGYSKNAKYRTDFEALKGGGYAYSSTPSSDDLENLDSFQKAYATAGTYDEIENVENMMDIREQIDYCLSFESIVGMSIIGLLKNLDKLNSELVNRTLFENVKDAVKYHDEFGDALKSVIEFSMRQKSAFDAVIASY